MIGSRIHKLLGWTQKAYRALWWYPSLLVSCHHLSDTSWLCEHSMRRNAKNKVVGGCTYKRDTATYNHLRSLGPPCHRIRKYAELCMQCPDYWTIRFVRMKIEITSTYYFTINAFSVDVGSINSQLTPCQSMVTVALGLYHLTLHSIRCVMTCPYLCQSRTLGGCGRWFDGLSLFDHLQYVETGVSTTCRNEGGFHPP